MSSYDKPRRTLSAYMYYVQACWKDHKKNNSNQQVDFKQFGRECGQRWRQMTDREKFRYQALSNQDRKRYEQEITEYREVKRKREKNIPKRPLSAYFWFCSDERPKVREAMPNARVTEIAKELGRRWRQCNDADRAPYVKLAAQDKARYQREMEATKLSKLKKFGDEDDRSRADDEESENEDEYDEDDCEEEQVKPARSKNRGTKPRAKNNR